MKTDAVRRIIIDAIQVQYGVGNLQALTMAKDALNATSQRELFAAMAMQNMSRVDFNDGHPVDVAERAVKFADALIEALNQETKE